MKAGLMVLILTAGCSGQHRPSAGAGGESFEQVRPIFAKYCSACHPSKHPPDWLDYASAKPYVDNGDLMTKVVNEKSMPPPGTAQAAEMTQADRQTIRQWILRGGPLLASEGESPASPIAQLSAQSRPCLQCHGLGEQRSESKIPRLAGQNAAYIKDQLTAFKWQRRIDPAETMNDIAYGLSDDDMNKIASDFSHAAGLRSVVQFDEKKNDNLAVQKCSSCHFNSEHGYGPADAHIPVLLGQSKQYLANQLLSYKSNRRPNSLMHALTLNLNDSDIDSIAGFLSATH